jgi:phage/plasmid-associated DNA primase
MREAEAIFENLQFARELDQDPTLLGVGNGVLILKRNGQLPELIQGPHDYKISRYTPVDYIPFDPNDENVKKVLKVFHDLHPDTEHDSFEFMMYYDASSLDGHKKQGIILINPGCGSNGKTIRCELLKGVLGEYASKLPIAFLTSTGGHHENATPVLMLFKTARLLYAGESNRNEVLNPGRLKEVTGTETLAGRALFSGVENFKPVCNLMVSTNYDFEIHDNTWGMWRRIKYMKFKNTFKLAHESLDPNNPFEKRANSDISNKWTEDPQILSAYLSILTYYYAKLYKIYGGKVTSVPHPSIIADTENFRIRQDFISRFLNQCMVKTVDEAHLTDMSEVHERFLKWYSARIGDVRVIKTNSMDMLHNSRLQRYLQKNDRGITFLKGFRILDSGESPADGEKYFYSIKDSQEKGYVVTEPVTKTYEEYHEELIEQFEAIEASRNRKDDSCDSDAEISVETAKAFHSQLFSDEDASKSIEDITNGMVRRAESNATLFKACAHADNVSADDEAADEADDADADNADEAVEADDADADNADDDAASD